MGNARWSDRDWDDYAAKTRGKSTSQIFNASAIKPEMDPARIALRRSRDSAANPASTPIILALDVTGSMGMIADALAREALGTLVDAILERKPVTDPHIMVMGVGDSSYDQAPLQVSQFEADIRIAEQLKNIWLEKGGGGNNHESYTLPWYFAAAKTDVDCVKHGRKGLLFTFGDEECPPDIRADHIRRVLGDSLPKDISTKSLLETVSEKYDVFHVVIEQGNYARPTSRKSTTAGKRCCPRTASSRSRTTSSFRRSSFRSWKSMPARMARKPWPPTWQGKTADAVRDALSEDTQGKPDVIAAMLPTVKFKKPQKPRHPAAPVTAPPALSPGVRIPPFSGKHSGKRGFFIPGLLDAARLLRLS